MGRLRRALEWLRDLDARYGYVKRARVVPGDPEPVRLRKLADTSEVVLVNPAPRSSYAPVARADVAPAQRTVQDEPDTGELPVVVVPVVDPALGAAPAGPDAAQPEPEIRADAAYEAETAWVTDEGEDAYGEAEDEYELDAEDAYVEDELAEDGQDADAGQSHVTRGVVVDEDATAGYDATPAHPGPDEGVGGATDTGEGMEIEDGAEVGTGADEPTLPYVAPPPVPNPDAVNRLRTHRPD